MSTGTKIALVLVALYLIGGGLTLAYIATTADDRKAAGKRVFDGFGGGEGPAGQLAESFFAWPVALAKSVGG